MKETIITYDINELLLILDELSFNPHLPKSFSKNLNEFNKETILEAISSATDFYWDWIERNPTRLTKLGIDFRIKSLHSVRIKYDRYINEPELFIKQ